jgi:glycosyltransferase involved in cell wall biosynthesis
MTPRVSVVLPTHDRASLLEASAAAVLVQTFDDLELLVVDDGSRDRTPDVVAELTATDGRVRGIRLPSAAGAPAARNAGLAAARGALVAYCDDDDVWLPAKLAAQVAVFDREPDVAVVSCHHELGDGRSFRGPVELDRADLLWANFLGGASNVVVRRSAAEPFDVGYRTCQDWDHWVRSAAHGEVRVVPQVLVRYRDSGDDRLTEQRDARRAGHHRFFDQHAPSMSARCRAYHRARQRVLAAPSERSEVLTAPVVAATTPPAVTWLLAGETAAARAGLASDPARGVRWLHAHIGGRR